MQVGTVISIGSVVVMAVIGYAIFIRPVLRARPEMAEFYTATDSFWSALNSKTKSIRTKLATRALMVVSGIVAVHDLLLPIFLGVDWTPITAKISPTALPFVTFGTGALFAFLKKLTNDAHAVEIEAVANGATPEEAKVIVGTMPLPPPPPLPPELTL